MKQGYLAILDGDKEYVERLGQYLNEGSFMMLRVLVFSIQDKLDQFLKKETPDFLLVNENLWKEEYISKNGILLCEELQGIAQEVPWIYKYQSARNIGQEIMDLYAKCQDMQFLCGSKKKVAILGVFSVGADISGTVFAWEMSRLLAEKYRVLYINLKSFCGMSSGLGKSWNEDLTDFIYFLRKGHGNLSVKLQAMIQEEEKFSYLPPVTSEEDLKEIGQEEWQQLLRAITQGLDYEKIVLDLSEMGGTFSFWLEQCDFIFTPVTDVLSQIRVQERRNWLNNRVGDSLLKKWVSFPADKFRDVRAFEREENLVLSNYIRHILEENRVTDGTLQKNGISKTGTGRGDFRPEGFGNY